MSTSRENQKSEVSKEKKEHLPQAISQGEVLQTYSEAEAPLAEPIVENMDKEYQVEIFKGKISRYLRKLYPYSGKVPDAEEIYAEIVTQLAPQVVDKSFFTQAWEEILASLNIFTPPVPDPVPTLTEEERIDLGIAKFKADVEDLSVKILRIFKGLNKPLDVQTLLSRDFLGNVELDYIVLGSALEKLKTSGLIWALDKKVVFTHWKDYIDYGYLWSLTDLARGTEKISESNN